MFGMPCDVNGEQRFIPFHLYSMKQAIEEGFILDVLKGYTTYKSYYKIISCTNDNPKYDKKKSQRKTKSLCAKQYQNNRAKITNHVRAFFPKQL
ncbi:hypothetical protein OLR46_05215 [Campylobacter jejuni]|nr:hypothetical protein [Campylobacter jejuni]